MEYFRVQKWDSGTLGDITLESVRKFFQQNKLFRISEKNYPPGSEFNSISREGMCYVVSGEVTFSLLHKQSKVTLIQQEFSLLPDGEFMIKVGAHTPATYIRVWRLPFEVK
jgi:hypothetical protein